MPIYEYRCEKCGEEFEELVRGNERPHCPACGAEELGKKWSVPATPHSTNEKGCPIRDAGGCGCTGCCGHQH